MRDAASTHPARAVAFQGAPGANSHRAALEWAYDMYVPDIDDRRSSLASPLLTEDLAGAPAAVIVSAQVDPVADDAERYEATLAAYGRAIHF